MLKKITGIIILLTFTITLAACNNASQTPGATSSSPEDGMSGEPKKFITLVADMSMGNEMGDELGLISRYEYGFNGDFTDVDYVIKVAAQGLSELTGLNFAIEGGTAYKSASVDWSSDATFIAGLGDITQKDEFFVYDSESLGWFMLDSMYRTILENFGGDNREIEVYYSLGGSNTITLPNGIELPIDIPYMGSPFYSAHNYGRGGGDNSNDWAVDWVPNTMLVMDTTGFDDLADGDYMMDGLLFVTLEVSPAVYDVVYDESSVSKRIESKIGTDIRATTATLSEEHSARLTFPTWLVVYEMGENEDVAHCVDLFFSSGTSDYWVHTQIPADWALDYRNEISKRLNTVKVIDTDVGR